MKKENLIKVSVVILPLIIAAFATYLEYKKEIRINESITKTETVAVMHTVN